MAAENKIGRGAWSDWSYPINTDEEAPEGPPQMLKTPMRNETSLLVRGRTAMATICGRNDGSVYDC